jgi:hypothetical protein
VSGSRDVPMDRTTDLETALGFVVRRIGEQAKASDHPLNDEEHSLLKNLPSSNINYLNWDPELGPPGLVPRNISLERLCALAKAAYLNDHKINSESLDWEFAFAVFRLNRHPMWGVLNSAGVKYSRPLWDQLFVIFAALVTVIAVIVLAWNGPPTRFRWAGILCATVAIMLLIYFASRRLSNGSWRIILRDAGLPLETSVGKLAKALSTPGKSAYR